MQLMKGENVKVIVVEPYFDLKTPNAVARETGGQVLVPPPSVGGEKEITDYFKLFGYDISKLKQAFGATQYLRRSSRWSFFFFCSSRLCAPASCPASLPT